MPIRSDNRRSRLRHGRTDAAAACCSGDRRLRGGSAPAAGGASGADAEDIPVNGRAWCLLRSSIFPTFANIN